MQSSVSNLQENRLKGKRVALVVDKLYIDNQPNVPRHKDYSMAILKITKFSESPNNGTPIMLAMVGIEIIK